MHGLHEEGYSPIEQGSSAMTADQLRDCRESFEKAHEEIYGAHPHGTLPNGRWRLWQIAWNTRSQASDDVTTNS